MFSFNLRNLFVFQRAHRELAFMFSLDAKAENKKDFIDVLSGSSHSRMQMDYERYVYIFMYYVQLFLLLS